jgi:hypothetical protein
LFRYCQPEPSDVFSQNACGSNSKTETAASFPENNGCSSGQYTTPTPSSLTGACSSGTL